MADCLYAVDVIRNTLSDSTVKVYVARRTCDGTLLVQTLARNFNHFACYSVVTFSWLIKSGAFYWQVVSVHSNILLSTDSIKVYSCATLVHNQPNIRGGENSYVHWIYMYPTSSATYQWGPSVWRWASHSPGSPTPYREDSGTSEPSAPSWSAQQGLPHTCDRGCVHKAWTLEAGRYPGGWNTLGTHTHSTHPSPPLQSSWSLYQRLHHVLMHSWRTSCPPGPVAQSYRRI